MMITLPVYIVSLIVAFLLGFSRWPVRFIMQLWQFRRGPGGPGDGR